MDFIDSIPSKSRHLNYIPDLDIVLYDSVMTPGVASQLYDRLEAEIIYLTGRESCITIYNRTIPIPRHHVAHGDYGLVYAFSGLTLPTKPWTPLLSSVKAYVEKILEEKFNYVLINKYDNGTHYVSHHADDEPNLDPLAPIATISLGATRHFNLKHKVYGEQYCMTVNLKHGSLLIMNFPTNRHYKHSILRKPAILEPRISLTFRRMLV